MDIRIHKPSQPIEQKDLRWWPFAIATAAYLFLEVLLFDFVMDTATDISIHFGEPPFWLESIGFVVIALLLPLGYPVAYVIDVYGGVGVYSANLVGVVVNGIFLMLIIRKSVNVQRRRGTR